MNTFDDIIQQKANRHEASVPPDAWNNIVKKKKKRRYVFFWWLSILLLTGLATGSYIRYINSAETEVPEKNNSSQSRETANTTNTGDKEKHTTNGQIFPEKDHKDIIPGNNDPISNNSQQTKNNDPLIAHAEPNDIIENTGNENIRNTSKSQKPENIQLTGNLNDRVKVISNTKKAGDDFSAARNRKIKKEKQRANVNITAPGTGELLTAIEEKSKTSEVTITGSSGKNEQKIVIETKKSITDQSTVIKNTLLADTLLKKSTPAKTVDNKTAAKSPGKKSKKRFWFIDFSVIPVLPLQQYDKSAGFSRTLSSSTNISEFSGKLVNTSIDPSMAFAISLRKEINKRIKAGIGLQYLQLKENISIAGTETTTKISIVDKLVNSVNGPILVSDTIKTITQGSRQINATNSYQFLSIPVFVQYIIVERPSWSLAVVAGANFNLYSRYGNEINSASTVPLQSNSQKPTDKNSIGVAGFGGFRVGKRIGKRMDLFAMPSVNWSLQQQHIKNSILDKKIQLLGINIGVSYKLN